MSRNILIAAVFITNVMGHAVHLEIMETYLLRVLVWGARNVLVGKRLDQIDQIAVLKKNLIIFVAIS